MNIMENLPVASICLDERKQRKTKNGAYPVRIRVYFEGKQWYYGLNKMKMLPDDFKKATAKAPKVPYDLISEKLKDAERKANAVILDIVTDLSYFEPKEFTIRFNKSTNKSCLFSRMQETINKLRSEDRISTAVTFECTLHSLQRFTGLETLDLSKVTVKFLNDFEKWMLKETTTINKEGELQLLKKSNSLTTIGIYLRNVRSILNSAIAEGKFGREKYPFGSGKYEIPSGQNIKKALVLSDIGLIYNYKCKEGSSEHKYRDLWLFSYLANGMNLRDMAKLKYKNIGTDSITFIRSKTERKNRKALRPIVVPLTTDIGRIIDTWGNKPAEPDNYIFDILKPGMNAQLEYEAIQKAVKLVNYHISNVAALVGIKDKVTSYTSRHSFASVLKRSGATVEFISESLGHSNLSTTENYLASFEIDQKMEIAKQLTNFDKS